MFQGNGNCSTINAGFLIRLTRMGAKVEGESYKPGYYATGDLNVDANGWRSPYYEEKTSNGLLCNGFMTKPTTAYSEYDKEMLKRTMLEHEAIFRQQVYELHRVYKIQRDLMKQCQNQEIYVHPILANASQTNSPSQIPQNGAKMIWQMQMPPVSTTYRKAPVAEHNDTNHSLKFLREGSVQSSPNGFPSSDIALNTKRGTFDLQLPADYYIDTDNASENKPIDFLGVASDTKPPNDADVTLVSAEGLGRFSDNSSTSGLQSTNNLGGRQVTDLNEPITGMYMGRTNGSLSRGLSYTLQNSWHQSVLRSSTTNFSFNKEYSKDKHTDEGTSSNFFDASAKIRQEEKPLADKGKQVSNINFFTPRYSDVDLQKSFKASDGRSASNSQYTYQGQNSSVGWFARSPLEASAINNFAILDRPRHSRLAILAAPVSIPHIDHPSVASPIGSCTVDPRSSVINNATFQSSPSFNGSSTVNSHTSLSAMTQSIGGSIHKLKNFDNLHGHHPGLPLDSLPALRSRYQVAISSDLEQNNSLMFEHSAQQSHEDPHFANGKGTKNFNLNEALSDGQDDVLVEQERKCVGSLQDSKGEGSVFGIPWLKNKSTCADPAGLEKSGKVFGHSNGTATEMKNNKDMTGTALNFCNLTDSASTFVGFGIKKDVASEDSTARTHLTCNKTQESARCLPLSCEKHVPPIDGQATEGVIKKSGAPMRNFIDLNDDVPNEDNSESSVVSHECHVASLQNNHAKHTFMIDLERPPCEDGAAWTSHQERTPSGKLDASKEAGTYFKSSIAAAENIVALSMDVPTTADTPDDMLQWFAELAVSSIDDHAQQGDVQDCINNSNDDDLDSFESLTLKLEETKIGEHWSRPQAPAMANDEQTVSTVNLLSKPKRGQQRRRRQKRDFQKDILPGLSTLPRPEIIEDIQLLEGLVQASGGSWESSLTRRGRYGGRTRGRKPRRNLSVTVEEEAQVSPPAKPDAADLEADDKGMIGWGRTTRRCRRPRCPSGNNIAAAS